MDILENVEIFALVGIRTTIARLSSSWPNHTSFAISAPKFRAAINKRTCLTLMGILFPTQMLRTWKRIEALCAYRVYTSLEIFHICRIKYIKVQ
jgi:hypothetical protein